MPTRPRAVSISREPASANSSTASRRVGRHRFVAVVGDIVDIVDLVETHLEVVTQRRAGDVAPLDEHDPVERRQLVQGEVVDVARALEPVDVGVVQRQPARQRIAVDERERRRRDRLGDAQRTPEALRERRLAGSPCRRRARSRHRPARHPAIAAATACVPVRSSTLSNMTDDDATGLPDERRTRGTRLPIPHTISYPIVPSRSAQSSARIDVLTLATDQHDLVADRDVAVITDVDHQLIHRDDAHDRAPAPADQHVAAGRSGSVPSRRGTPSA